MESKWPDGLWLSPTSFFADYSLLFARENSKEAYCILKVYQDYFGNMVNLENSEASFSQNVLEEDKIMICNRMGVNTVTRKSK